jgi:hypothetical protein
MKRWFTEVLLRLVDCHNYKHKLVLHEVLTLYSNELDAQYFQIAVWQFRLGCMYTFANSYGHNRTN